MKPKVFYTQSIGRSTFRVILIHHKQPLCLGGAFQFQCLVGKVSTMATEFCGEDYSDNALTPVCLPGITHNPIEIRTDFNPLFPGNKEIIKKRLNEVDVSFDAVEDACREYHYSAIILITDPPIKVKSIDSITQLISFKPLPEFQPEPLSEYCFITKSTRPLLNSNNANAVHDFCARIHKAWYSSKQSVAMVVGPKDSGKSTISKYISNALLSLQKANSKPVLSLYYLDCDVGQSEFTPPGLISLFKVKKPFTSVPCASQIRSFQNSYFYGANNPQGDLDLYKAILQECFSDFFKLSCNDSHALLIINTLGWVENFGVEILDFMFDLFAPACSLTLTTYAWRGYKPKMPTVQNILVEGYTVPQDRKIIPAKLRALNITGYFTQCFAKSLNFEVTSFSDVSVRMVSFNKIGLFIHPANLVSERAYLAAFNMATVALCFVPQKYMNSFTSKHLCDKKNMPKKIEANPESKAFLQCIGYGLVRAISIEKGKIYLITPVEPQKLSLVTVLAKGDDINTPLFIFQTQNSTQAPYLMDTGNKNNVNDFGLLSMPLKVIGMHKRNAILRRGN